MRRLLDPRQNQISTVVGNQSNVAAPGLRIPAHKAVARPQMPWRARPRQTRNGLPACFHQILQLLPDRLLLPEIVILLDQAVEQRFVRATPHQLDLKRNKPTQWPAYRPVTRNHQLRSPPLRQWIACGTEPHRRQLNLAGSLQLQEEPATELITKRAIRLLPVPGFT